MQNAERSLNPIQMTKKRCTQALVSHKRRPEKPHTCPKLLLAMPRRKTWINVQLVCFNVILWGNRKAEAVL